MLSVYIKYVVSRDLSLVRHNNQDGNCSLTSSNAKSKLYHRNGMCPAESFETD